MTLRRSNVSCRSSEWNAMQTVMHFLRRSEYSSGISPNTSDSSIRYENGDRQAHIWYRVPVHFGVRQSHHFGLPKWRGTHNQGKRHRISWSSEFQSDASGLFPVGSLVAE